MEQRGQSQARLSYAESRQSSRNSNCLNYAERERARRSQVCGEVSAESSDGAARAEPSSLELCRVATEFEELKSL